MPPEKKEPEAPKKSEATPEAAVGPVNRDSEPARPTTPPPPATMEEYKEAYRQLKETDPETAAVFPNPNTPGQNIDVPTVMAELRRRTGGLRGVGRSAIKTGPSGPGPRG